MAGVIKGGFYGNNIIVNGEVEIKNGTAPAPVVRTIKDAKADSYDGENFGGDEENEEQPVSTSHQSAEKLMKVNRELEMAQQQLDEAIEESARLRSEGDKVKNRLISEGEAILAKAKSDTEKLVREVKENAEKMHAEAVETAEKLKLEAGEKGYAEGNEKGYSEGLQKGYDEGYLKGLKKCKDTLLELKNALETLEKDKENFFKGYERQMFDTIFDIAQKITLDSLKQKDKSVLQKMLKQAAKSFRTSENIRVTLSAIDVSEDIETSLEALKSCFGETQHVDFEILKDAPSGTLIVDNGNEITDAGIGTQLKMIEELGKGKYRDKPDSNPPKTIAEIADEQQTEIEEAVEIAEQPEFVEAEAVEEKNVEIQPENIAEDIQTEAVADNVQPAEPISAEQPIEQPEEKPKPKKRPRKATNPLLTKMMGQLENSQDEKPE